MASRWRRWAGAVLAVIALVPIVVAIGLHAPPVRSAVLRRLVPVLDQRFGIALSAERLDYNLFALRVALDGVRLAATGDPETPFLEAGRIAVAFPSSVLLGPFSIDAVQIDDLQIIVERRADGTSNLPAAESGGADEPAAILIRQARIPRLSLQVRDEAADVTFSAPEIAIELDRNGGEVRLVESGEIRRGNVTTSLTALDGEVGFDGRVLHLSDLEVATDEAALVVDGELALIDANPGLDLRLAGTADLAGLARWRIDQDVPTGTIAFDAEANGAFSSPQASLRLRSDSLSWQNLTATALDAELTVSPEQLVISGLDATVWGGRVSLNGETRFDTGVGDLAAAWTDVDAGEVVRTLAPDQQVGVTGQMTGTASARGPVSGLDAWTVDVSNRTEPRPFAPRSIPLSGVTSVMLANGDWALDGDHRVGDTSIRTSLGGRFDVERIRSSALGGTVAVSSGNLQSLIATLVEAGVVETLPVTLTSGQFEASAEVGGTFVEPRFAVSANATNLDVEGISDLEALVTGTGSLQQFELEATIQQDTGNEFLASATVSPGTGQLTGQVTGTLQNVAAFARGAPVAGLVEFALDGGGTFDALRGQGTVTVTDARYGTVQLGRLESTIALEPAEARVDATLGDLGARANAAITLEGPRRAAVELQLDNTELARALRDVETPVPMTGRVTLSARAEGPLDDWRQGTGALDIMRVEATAGDLPISLTAPARITYDREVVEVVALDATASDLRLTASGRLPLFANAATASPQDALRVELVGDLGAALQTMRVVGLSALPDLSGSGPLSLTASVTGSAEQPLVVGDLELSQGSLTSGDLPPATAMELRARVADGWLELLGASLDWQGSSFTSTGRLPLRLLDTYLPAEIVQALPPSIGPASLTTRVDTITPTVLTPFLDAETLTQLEGSIDLAVDLNAPTLTLDGLQGTVTLNRLDLRMAGLPVTQQTPTSIVLDGGFARVAAWDWTGQGASLAVRGQMRLADRQTAILANGRVDLRMLTPFVRDAGLTMTGLLEPRVSLTGSLDNLRIDGDVLLTQSEIRLAEPQIVATELTARAVLSRTTAYLTSVSGQLNGGSLSGRGEITYGPGTSLAALFTTGISGMALDFPDGFLSEMNADLTLELSASPTASTEGRVSGLVTVVESAYREPLVVVTGLLSALRAERLAAAVSPQDSILNRLELDVGIVTENDTVVDNNLARLELGTDLRLIGTAAAPSLSGRAELREGGQLFLGRNVYTLQTGLIDFANPVVVEPSLNVQAQTRAGGEDIQLTMTGTPETLEVELSSSSAPELGEADLASLLLTGRKLDELPGADAQVVGEQVLGYLSGDVLGVAGRAVGFDTLRLGGAEQSLLRRDPTAVATETDPTSRLTVGRGIGDRFEVTLSQSLRDGAAQTWILDYLAAQRVNLRLVSGDDTLRAYEFRHDVSFGGGPRVGTAASTVVSEEQRVTDIAVNAVTGDLVLDELRLRGALGIASGDAFDFARWQRGREQVEALHRNAGYREVRVTGTRVDAADGVALAVDIEAGPLTSVTVVGYQLRAATLRALDEAWARSIFDDFLLEDARTLVRTALADDGFPQADVVATITTNGGKELRLVIDPGVRTSQRRVRVDANDRDLAAELEARILNTPLEAAAWRDPEAVRQDFERTLQARGYLRGEVTVGEPRLVDDTVLVGIAVEPGALFTVAGVRVDGADRVTTAVLLEGGSLEAGAPYDPVAVDQERRRLASVYRDRGFAGAVVTVQPMIDEGANQVTVAFVVDEGPRQVLREVTFQGNTGINDDVLARALALPIGQPLSGNAWLQARSRIFETGLLQRVDVSIEPLVEPAADPTEEPVRARVTVQEWPALRLRYGFRVSEERPEGELDGRELTPGLSADLTRRTLFGRAVSLGGALDYRRRFQRGRVFAGTPTFFGWPIESIVTLQRSREDFATGTFVTNRAGVSWEQRVLVASNLQLSYSYRFDRDHTFDTEPPPGVPALDIEIDVARLTGAAVYDTRDDAVNTTLGSLFASNFEFAPEGLGSEIQFIRYVGQAYYFRPWRRIVFASAARIGLAKGLAGQELIPSERFFAGGARSVRGAAEEGLGPVDFFGPSGGGGLLVFNQEARFPIYGWLGGVGFTDAGNVFTSPSAIRLGDLVGSVGVGLRLSTPFALLRVDYGRLLSPGSGERTGRWTFGIGQAF